MLQQNDFPISRFPDFEMVVKVIKRIVSKMVVQIKSGKRENGTSFGDNLYRKRSTVLRADGPSEMDSPSQGLETISGSNLACYLNSLVQ